MENTIDVSIIIVNYNLTESIRKLLKSIQNYASEIKYEVIIVDNNSPDRSIKNLEHEFPDFQFIWLGTNCGFGCGNNAGEKISKGKYLLFLNPDTYLVSNLLLELFTFAEGHTNFGVIAPRLIFPDGRNQGSYAKYPNIKQEFLYAIRLTGIAFSAYYKLKDFFYRSSEFYFVDFVFGSCLFIRRDIFESVNGFDEDFFLFSEETDLCYRIKKYKKQKIVYWKKARIVHEKSLITGKNMPVRIKTVYESRLKFIKKHYSKFRLFLLKYTIIAVFLFKHLTLFKDGEPKNKYKEAYQAIIKHYMRN